MAQAALNFDEKQLDKSSDLFQLYDRLYQGMVKANEVDAPAFPASEDLVIRDEEGQILFDKYGNPVLDTDKIAEVSKISDSYSEVLLKNSAYLFANSILSVLSGGSPGGTETIGYVSRAGDSMKGALNALYGFSAGLNGQTIFEVSIDANENKLGIISGSLKTTENVEVAGNLLLSDAGIYFDDIQTIFLDNDTLTLKRQNISLNGDVSVEDGKFKVGSVEINSSGIYFGKNEYYHSGNANNISVDWTMNNALVNNQLAVNGDSEIKGKLTAINGFKFGVADTELLYSVLSEGVDENGKPTQTTYTVLQSDLKIINGYGIKFADNYIINIRNKDVISFSAPGMIMNFGDSDNSMPTSKISLQSDIWDYSNNYKIISKEGAGYFPNGLMARCAVSGSSVLETYRIDNNNVGVLFPSQIRFSSTEGASLKYIPDNQIYQIEIPYTNSDVADNPIERLKVDMYFSQTTSPFKNKSLEWSASLHFNTFGEFFSFDKPIESEYLAVKSERYKTKLIENALFFDDGKFIEGVTDGLRYSGNGYFNGDVSSTNFASGFAGYGWAVKDEITNGGFHATFDTLTIRKKMRVYELEVQKTSCTNGSLWVSDSCSGDEVIVIE